MTGDRAVASNFRGTRWTEVDILNPYLGASLDFRGSTHPSRNSESTGGELETSTWVHLVPLDSRLKPQGASRRSGAGDARRCGAA
jgi:hypothetical protein